MNKGIKRFDRGITYHIMGGALGAFIFNAAFSQNMDGSGYNLYDVMVYVTEPGTTRLKFFLNIDELKSYAISINIPFYEG